MEKIYTDVRVGRVKGMHQLLAGEKKLNIKHEGILHIWVIDRRFICFS